MVCVSTGCYNKKDHPKYVNVVTVCRIASVEDDRLGRDVRSVNSTDAAIDHDEVFRDPHLE